MMQHAEDSNERIRDIPGLRAAWHAFVRVRNALCKPVIAWYKRFVRREPTEVVKSNTRRAWDHFYSDDTFVETDYLRDSRRAFYSLVADYCVGRLPEGSSRAIDVGCGTGHLLLALQERTGSRLDLAGMDFSNRAIARTRALVPTATLQQADIFSIPWPDDSFDLVLSMETLEHLRTPDAALAQLVRVCKPGGSIVLTVPNGEVDDWEGHFSFWSPEALRVFIARFADVREVLELPDSGDLLAWAVKHPSSEIDASATPAEEPQSC